MKRKSEPRRFFDDGEQEAIVNAIGAAESKGDGEVRVHVGRGAGAVMESARAAFEALGMTATERRAGVLVFVLLDRHEVAVIGDAGIHAAAPPELWDELVADVTAGFRRDEPAAGILTAIEKIGDAFARWVSFAPGDAPDRSLPDDVSFDPSSGGG